MGGDEQGRSAPVDGTGDDHGRQDLAAALNPFARRRASSAGDDGEERFRIGELARRADIAVGTIKYYVREGLLPPGEATSRTQALYGPQHLRRLRTIRVLADVGGLSVDEIRTACRAMEDVEQAGGPLQLQRAVSGALARAMREIPEPPGDDQRAERDAQRRRTDAFVDAIGLTVEPGSPAREQLAAAFGTLERLGFADDPLVFTRHAELARTLAEFEIGQVAEGSGGSPEEIADDVVVGTVVFGAAFMALRAMAHESASRALSARG